MATLNNFLTPNVTLSNPFPTGILQPVGAAQGVNTFVGQNVTFANMRPSQPYSLRWTLGIQQELRRDLVLELGYTGSHALHMTEDHDLNFYPNQFLSTSPVRDQAAIDRLTAIVANPFRNLLPGTSLNGATTSAENLLRAFPHFNGEGGVRIEGDNNGSSYFHMFQARLEKRFSNGLQFLANYQYSKLIERDRRLYAAAPALEKRISDDDRPQRLVFSASYDLPLGKGRLLGGWTLNGIYTAQPGPPLNWESANAIYFGGDLRYSPRSIDEAFDVTRFERNARNQLERNQRTFPTRFSNLRSDMVNNFDLSAIKSIPLTERFHLQYRFEAFNALNRPSFAAASVAQTNANFGRINDQANLPRAVQMALRLRW